MKIVIVNDKFIKSSVLNLSEEGLEFVISFFKKHNMELNYNNTASVFWVQK